MMNAGGSRRRGARNRWVVAAALLVLSLAAPATAHAGTLDIEQAGFGASRGLIGTHENGQDVRHAQTFEAGATGLLDQVDLWVRVVGDPGVPLSVEITALDGGGLPSTVLGSAIVAQADVPACNTAACIDKSPAGDYSTFVPVSVLLTAPAAVISGTAYAIVLSASGATLDIYGDMVDRSANRYEWAGLDNEFMFDGGIGLSFVGAVGWDLANVDRAFRTYVGGNYVATVGQPINADGSSNFKANRGVVPVKFTLTLDGSPTCALPPATIALTQTSGAAIGPVNESSYLMAADTGSSFRTSDCQYIYNLNAKSLGSGTYLVEIKIDGDLVGSATFDLR